MSQKMMLFRWSFHICLWGVLMLPMCSLGQFPPPFNGWYFNHATTGLSDSANCGIEAYIDGQYTDISDKTVYLPFGATQSVDSYAAIRARQMVNDKDVFIQNGLPVDAQFDTSWTDSGTRHGHDTWVSGPGEYEVYASYEDDRVGPQGADTGNDNTCDTYDAVNGVTGTYLRSGTISIFQPSMTQVDYIGMGETKTLYGSCTPSISNGTYSWECSSNLIFVETGNTSAQSGSVTIKPVGISSSSNGDWVRVRYQTSQDGLGRTPTSGWVYEYLTCIMDLDIDDGTGQNQSLSETDEDEDGGRVAVGYDRRLPYAFGPVPSGSYLKLEVIPGTGDASLRAYVPGYGWQWIVDPYQIDMASIPSTTELWVHGDSVGSDNIVKLSILDGYDGATLFMEPGTLRFTH